MCLLHKVYNADIVSGISCLSAKTWCLCKGVDLIVCHVNFFVPKA
jgi:hypothetical protein